MKNREYKNRNRAIKEVAPGNWRCRLIPGKGLPELPVFNVRARKQAFDWLDGAWSIPQQTKVLDEQKSHHKRGVRWCASNSKAMAELTASMPAIWRRMLGRPEPEHTKADA